MDYDFFQIFPYTFASRPPFLRGFSMLSTPGSPFFRHLESCRERCATYVTYCGQPYNGTRQSVRAEVGFGEIYPALLDASSSVFKRVLSVKV